MKDFIQKTDFEFKCPICKNKNIYKAMVFDRKIISSEFNCKKCESVVNLSIKSNQQIYI